MCTKSVQSYSESESRMNRINIIEPPRPSDEELAAAALRRQLMQQFSLPGPYVDDGEDPLGDPEAELVAALAALE